MSRYLRIVDSMPRKAVSAALRVVAGQRAIQVPPTAVPTKEPFAGRKLARFDTAMLLNEPGVKSFREVKDKDGTVQDYLDVKLKGYLSTFNGTDRQGDTVLPGAFKDAIVGFMRNPVLLLDHHNSASRVAGRFDVVREDNRGLYVEATMSNSPGVEVRDARWKVAEGMLGALSMGGYFHYEQDGRTISKVDLYEGSIVAIPANQDALFAVRDVEPDEVKRFGRQ